MEPIAIKKPEKNDVESQCDGGNLMLMEARSQQLLSSIRALIRSNKDLNDALIETPNDSDFLDAFSENHVIILKQRTALLNLVIDMKRQGADIDVPEDIVQEANQIQEELSVAVAAASISQEEIRGVRTSGDEGIYL
mmetsp:Transcript_2190/g.3255  ORF Transcript_2190/g.3255 Transcript_2190/m.3255 type:complete len:137 (+) Transcript_2190:143-553(+)|eukprot:CAMPEP_0194224764 /NCGR_PEP_ID=MMETSP0156-20130528/38099_1 /TAXON_ID=33649 /ORGANISM="Thalassionema nitzschioides, Strain L26-B" /LENGTH=136 /DNA_ID=CAMNT_0038956457 /DNA_START=97 /DNA_END=507 /DNA_ORIENTATION=-